MSTEIDIIEQEQSVLDLVTPAVRKHIEAAMVLEPVLFDMEEKYLYQELCGMACRPNAIDNRIRVQFWLEYDTACAELRIMEPVRIYSGVCSLQAWYKMLSKPAKVAWMMLPPVHYINKMKAALDFGVDMLDDILKRKPEDYENENAQIKFMELQVKIISMLDQRISGAYTQKIEQKNMNLNISTTDKAVGQALIGNNMEEINRRIKELEKRERKAQNVPEDIEVRPSDISKGAVAVITDNVQNITDGISEVRDAKLVDADVGNDLHDVLTGPKKQVDGLDTGGGDSSDAGSDSGGGGDNDNVGADCADNLGSVNRK